MKKLTSVFLTAMLAASLTACSQGSSGQGDDSRVINIAVIKQLDHASLDEIANAITGELDALAKANNVTIKYTVDSGQNDPTTLQQFAAQYVSSGVDAIIPIATLAAQTMTSAAEEKQIPVVYAAISDPEGASLTGFDNVTGTSDALNTKVIMDMMFDQNPAIKTVGLLYSMSEPNSEKPIAEAKAYLDAKKIAYVEATGNTNDEIAQAVSSLVASKVDAVFTPTDNVVMATELVTAQTLAEAGIPHYTGADSFVRNGAFTTCGVNYTELGKKTADLAYQAVTSGMADMEDYYLMDGGIVTVNTETAADLKADYSMFSKYGEIVEVTTTEN
ncbi:MAG TPA: ABC transporter [Erysipelotrichaceae bacterium]|nr:ABC transporter [Erysipelotrichaceae bacterium]